MSIRQKILKAVYPAFMWFSKNKAGENAVLENKENARPTKSIYDLSLTLNDGQTLPLASLKGKKIIFVNTASDCGFTNQYEALQALHEKYNNEIAIIGFPANDFKEQEKGTDEEIAAFCKKNYGVSFPLAKKTVVIPNADQHPVFQWLSQSKQNGWNDQSPVWNFSKYLVDEHGVLQNYFGPSVSPDDETFLAALKK